jgi:hypothetical protein
MSLQTVARICIMYILQKLHNLGGYVYQILLFFHLRPTSNPTITSTALCHKKFDAHCCFVHPLLKQKSLLYLYIVYLGAPFNSHTNSDCFPKQRLPFFLSDGIIQRFLWGTSQTSNMTCRKTGLFFWMLHFRLSGLLHQRPILIFILLLLFSEGQRDEAWKTLKKQCPFRCQGPLDRKVLQWFLSCKG